MSGDSNKDAEPKIPTPANRPRHHESLLSHPISDGANVGRCYPGWEQHHGRKIRFYIAGWSWFTSVSALHRPEDLLVFGEGAVKAAANDNTWVQMIGQKHIWSELGLPQFRSAVTGNALFFQKAALILLACELALEAQKGAGKLAAGWEPLDVYNYMAIVPACWHVNDFDKGALDKLHSEGLRAALRDAALQDQKDFIDDMPVGYTYSLPTASAVHAFLRDKMPSLGVGAVNPRPVATLGTRAATTKEKIELDRFRRQ